MQRRQFDFFIGGGNIGYCDDHGCKIVASKGFTYPNGLVRGQDQRIYIPSSITGEIYIMQIEADHSLTKVKTLVLPQPIDNLSVDKKGYIFAATFPEAHKFLKSMQKPFEIFPSAAVWRIRRSGDNYEIERILEGDGSRLPGATVAVHDPRTGRIFMGGEFTSPTSTT